MKNLIIYFVYTSMLLFIVLSFIILNKNKKNYLELLLDVALTFFMVFLSFQYFRWILINHYLKYVIIILYVLNCIYILINNKKIIIIKKNKMYYYFKTILLIIFIILNLMVFYGKFPNEQPIDLIFPLKNGNYYVYQGGKFPFYNLVHYTNNRLDKYSMDVVKINKLGFDKKKLFNKEFSNFEIYNEIIYSPCDGKVLRIVNDKNDGFNEKEKNKINNGIFIKYKDYKIVLAHIKKDTFFVKEGDVIKIGDKIGLVGSAGCNMPHLHIQVMKNNKPIQFTFSNKFYSDNCSIKIE